MPPSPGDIVHVRSRHYVVENASSEAHGLVVDLACLDDDAQGDRLQAIWELELDARVITEEAWDAIGQRGFDPQDHFAAFFNTLRWHCVTSTDPRILQSPFRAGIRLDPYQLDPLSKALRLPRVNMFIADDVGLGKTIEAGLIASELLLRRRIDTLVIACPPGMLGQWKDEMETRFGLMFEVFDRHFVERTRQERGYGINPWRTRRQFLVSSRLLIDPNYTEPMREWLGEFCPRTLFIFDEAHHAAPASGAKYAIDSKITRAIRDLSQRFEHRVFLSATPHNGHSNSFSSLLEILDPHRFTRGVKPTKENLDAIMVRRVKEDIRQIQGGFPKREIVEEQIDGLPEDAPELALAALLAEYSELGLEQLEGADKRSQSSFKLAISGLQQRLFSSIDGFARTLAKHRSGLDKAASKVRSLGKASAPVLTRGIGSNDDLADASDEEIEAVLGDEMERLTQDSAAGDKAARIALLDQMREIAESSRYDSDARVIRLLEWMQENMWQGTRIPGKRSSGGEQAWEDTRIIIFTEYRDTLNYLRDGLHDAIGTEQSKHRIAIYHGGTPEHSRESIKSAFQGKPGKHPVRILLANDAAREGLNLQAHCHRIFHFDLPWNPGRLEQRNGRIDRKLQPNSHVYCHYFRYIQRPEDRILKKLVEKSERILEELGSLSQILGEQISESLTQKGIRRTEIDQQEQDIDKAGVGEDRIDSVKDELETTRERQEELRERFEALDRQLEQSRKTLHFQSATFQGALSRSLEMAGFPPLRPTKEGRFEFPVEAASAAVDQSWGPTLDSLREPPTDGRRDYRWRKDAPVRPVTFTPPETIDDTAVQLHLGHRVSQRLLSRFVSQGFRDNDLSRACFGQSEDDIPRVILLGRLGLYGPGASRLHEEVITITARWTPPGERGDGGLQPYARDTEAKTMGLLQDALSTFESDSRPPADVEQQLLSAIETDVAELRSHLEVSGEFARDAAAKRLAERGRIESDEITRVLNLQKARIEKTLNERKSGMEQTIDLFTEKSEIKQLEDDMRFWRKRLDEFDLDLENEPKRIREFYTVETTRIEPAGIVYLWPANK